MAGIGLAPSGPWWRKMSATSSLGRRTAAGLRSGVSASPQVSGASRSSGLVTLRIVLVATRV